MPTRPARRERRRKGVQNSAISKLTPGTDNREAGTLQNATSGLPTPLDCGIASDGSALMQLDVGPIPDGIAPGQAVSFEYMSIKYEVAVPEGCGPGCYFRCQLALDPGIQEESRPPTNAGHGDLCGSTDNVEIDGLPSHSDDSTCIGGSDVEDHEEDPMWSTDWTIEQVLSASEHAHIDGEDAVGWSEDCYVEQQPDSVSFENCEGCSTSYCGEQSTERVEVFNLSDVTTWFTRLQQRREQALRSGKAKLVRKIDQEIGHELEKSRCQGYMDADAVLGNRQVEDEYSELDGIWSKDWASLAVAV